MTHDDSGGKAPAEGAASAPDEGGLEIDERQVREMRSIFGASLSQYIEPLEQNVHLILSGGSDPDVVRTFSASARSLREAAEKLGFADVSGTMADLEDAVVRVAGMPGEVTREDRHAVLGFLDDLIRLGAQLGGPQERMRGTFLVERLAGMPDSGQIVVQLARAGLVLDEQLLTAKPDEIAAVSGLTPAVVARVLAWLRGEPAAPAVATPAAELPDAAPPATPARAPASPGVPLRALADAKGDDAPPTPGESLAREITALDAARTRLESRLEEARIDLGRGRERLEHLLREQSTLDSELSEVRAAEEDLDEWLSLARELRDRLAQARDLRARALETAREDLGSLRDRITAVRGSVQSEETNVASARAALRSLESMISEIQARASRSRT